MRACLIKSSVTDSFLFRRFVRSPRLTRKPETMTRVYVPQPNEGPAVNEVDSGQYLIAKVGTPVAFTGKCCQLRPFCEWNINCNAVHVLQLPAMVNSFLPVSWCRCTLTGQGGPWEIQRDR
ncbi:hypothetical protein J6590_056265 [Homalodisca vitripennis]|nr:hypothetical protein J6590_056265 [Homalodisca vitripennis]